MADLPVIPILLALFALRLFSLRRFWRLPLRQGEEWFFTAPVAPGFYRGAGLHLLRRYRLWLFAPLVTDAVVVVTMISFGRAAYVFYEQFVSSVLNALFCNFLLIGFASRAKAFAATEEAEPISAVSISLQTRRLGDYSKRIVELIIGGLTVVALAMLADHFTGLVGGVPLRTDQTGASLRGVAFDVVWLLYIQLGLLLLKGVFVHWRMKVPTSRTEDYLRWRREWLAYHVGIFDGVRVLCAVKLLALALQETFEPVWNNRVMTPVAGSVWVLIILVWVGYCIRLRRRLAVVEREIEPVRLAKVFPPAPVAAGTFLAGGLFYYNPDNPVLVVRSPLGIAFNLAHKRGYFYLAYLAGLILLMGWMVTR
ncbi:MAG TPA: hypothetical protein VFD58_34810 [Blastocatellia bacterium]|nr:hypothetical protein [Blastocatellia bacterium]